MPELRVGDKVTVQPHRIGDKQWQAGEIIATLPDRSYRIKTSDGNIISRNRKNLRFFVHTAVNNQVPEEITSPQIIRMSTR